MALDIVIIVIRVRKCSTIMIGIFWEDVVIIVVYKIFTRLLAEELIIGIKID